MTVNFAKYHGTGNDFILIDNRTDFFSVNKEFISNLCHRRFGIGADGLILLNKANGFDFEMLYFNSDGNQATMCGNGGRCIVAFAQKLGIIQQNAIFKAVDGLHTARILEVDKHDTLIELSLNDVELYHFVGADCLLDTGSPHLVRFMEYSDLRKFNVKKEGRKIRYRSPYTNEGINVNFVWETSEGIFVRTYERGVEAETLSCGTGVTASALAWSLNKNLLRGPVEVFTRGGNLTVDFEKADEKFIHINLTGLATFVFTGKYSI